MKRGRDRLLDTLRVHVTDKRVLEAMGAVPRDRFVPPELAAEAWENAPLPIGAGQTISQPLVVARMCELLELTPADRVLDVGTGSGYHAALLAYLPRTCGASSATPSCPARPPRTSAPRAWRT